MAYIDDDTMDELINQLKEDFGEADKKAVTESSYSFSGKHKEMREDLAMLSAMNKEGAGRLRMKSKLGFD